jgi:hypothetical protein
MQKTLLLFGALWGALFVVPLKNEALEVSLKMGPELMRVRTMDSLMVSSIGCCLHFFVFAFCAIAVVVVVLLQVEANFKPKSVDP